MEDSSLQNFVQLKVEEEKEEETGTSLFHQRMAQERLVHLQEDTVCMIFQMRDKQTIAKMQLQYSD